MSNQLQNYVDTQVAEISPYLVKSNALLADAELLDVTDADSAKEAATLRKSITAHENKVEAARKNITRQFDDVKKQFIKKEKEVLEPAIEAKKLIQDKLVEYEKLEAERRAAEEKRIAEITAKFAVSIDGLETPEEVDMQLATLENTAGSLPPEDRKLPQVSLAYAEAKNKLLQHKDDLMLGAETDEAEMGDAAAAMQEAADAAEKAGKAMAKMEPKLGLKTKTLFEITDPGLVPRSLCEPSEKLIRAVVKEGTIEIPGVRIWTERSF